MLNSAPPIGRRVPLAACCQCRPARGLIALAACLLWSAGCGQTPTDAIANRGIGGASDYVGADVCVRCHSAVHEGWTTSKHAGAFETLRGVGAQDNAACLPCHTTGFEQGGFVSDRLTPKFGGVQCEACHGPAATHVGTRNPNDVMRLPGTTTCGRCHTGPAQPNLEEWSDSGHASALASVLADPNGADECLICHSTDYAAVVRRNASRAIRALPPDPLPSLFDGNPGTDPAESVGCPSCHAPHGSVNLAELRSAPTATCATCHTDTQTAPGTPPHAPQFNVLTGTGGLMLPAGGGEPAALVVAPAVHAALDALGGCAKCHGPNVHVEQPTEAVPNQSGHRFEVLADNCLPCHSAQSAASAIASLRAEIEARMSALRARADALEATPLLGPQRRQLSAAVLNLDLLAYDGSFGAHHAQHARELLDAAEALLDAATP